MAKRKILADFLASIVSIWGCVFWKKESGLNQNYSSSEVSVAMETSAQQLHVICSFWGKH